MMQSEMIHTDRVLIVEGKYDAARLAHLTDAMILLTDGFGIYSDKKRQQLFKALAQKNGLILLTDSDAAGFRIRNYITNMVGAQNVVQAYVPAIHGKEKAQGAARQGGPAGGRGRGRRPLCGRHCWTPWARKPVPRRCARRDGRSPTPTCTSGGFPASPAAPSARLDS